MSTYLCGKNISFSYTVNAPILTHLNFKIFKGESLGILGENGAGKSTLLQLIATGLFPDQGELNYNSTNCFSNLKQYRSLVSWLPGEGSGFYSRLNGKENLELFFSYRTPLNDWKRKRDQWMEIKSFREAYTRPFYICSSGMKQALALFRCLQTKADIYLIDEPTRFLDQNSKDFLSTLLHQADKLQIITSHDAVFLKNVTTQRRELKDAQLLEKI